MTLPEKMLSKLLELSPDAILVVDHTGKIVNSNAQAETLFGYQQGELSGVVVENLIPKRLQKRHIRHRETYMDAPVRRPMGRKEILWGRRKDDREIPLDIMLSTLNDNDLVIATIRDITDRQKIEAQLIASQQSHEEAQRISRLGHWDLDLVKDELKWSNEVFRIFEKDPNGFKETYKAFLDAVHPDDREMVDNAYTASVKSKIPYTIDHRLLMKDGRVKWIQERCETVYSDDGTPLRSVGTVQDITRRYQAQKQIEEQLARLKSLREIDLAILNTTDLRIVLKTIIDETRSRLLIDDAAIHLLDPNSLMLKEANPLGYRSATTKDTVIRLGECIAGRAALQRRIIALHNIDDEEKVSAIGYISADLIAFWKREGIKAIYSAPLITKGQVIGTYTVYFHKPFQADRDWLDFYELLVGQTAMAIDSLQLFESSLRTSNELMVAYDATIEGWAHALELRDRETKGHTLRVTEMVVQLAREMGMSEEQIVHVRRGGLLHDMGKLGIPDSILHKPEKLSNEEWDIMRQHPQYAYEMLFSIEYLRPALDIPYCHHEKWDGTGYPRGLKGERIPLVARIFAVVDVWDALRSDRPYRDPWTNGQAREYIVENAGKHFDPDVVEAFLKIIGSSIDF